MSKFKHYKPPFYHLAVIKSDVLVILQMHAPHGKVLFEWIIILTVMIIIPGCDQYPNEDKGMGKDTPSSGWKEMISTYPDSFPIQIEFVNHLLNEGQSGEAIDSLLHWTEKQPEQSKLLNFAAEAGIQVGDTALAIHWMQQSLATTPNQPDILMRISGILLSRKDSTWTHFRNLLLSDTDDMTRSKGHFINGIALANENKTESALQALDSSIILNFTFTDAYIEKAILLMEKKAYSQALTLLYKALELDRKSSDIHYLVGTCLDKLDKHEQAIPYYQQALNLDPSHEGAANKLKESKH